jgi:SAM-dependent methyltransferase
MSRLVLTPVLAQSAIYQQTLRDEITIGESASIADLKTRRIEHPAVLAYKSSAATGVVTPNYESWLDPLLDRIGPRHHALSLGSGRGRVERHWVETGRVTRFDSLDVYTHEGSSVQDLNFAQLPKNRYDLILCHGVLHHLINLEAIIEQISDALTPDGVFLVYEFVGARQWQFDPGVLDAIRRRYEIPVKAIPRWKVGGFESVRSNELLPLIRSVFGGTAQHEVSYGGVLMPFLQTCGTPDDLRRFLDDAIQWDATVTREGSLPPCYHVGVYGKSAARAPETRPWTLEELHERLDRRMPLVHAWADRVKRSTLGPHLRNMWRVSFGR